ELAEKVDLTASFISQLESNHISPSLSSFMQICSVLGVTPSAILEGKNYEDVRWLIPKEKIFSALLIHENGLKGYRILKNGNMSGTLVVLEPFTKTEKNFTHGEGKKFIYVLKGEVSVVVDGKEKTLRSGDSVFLKEEVPSLWKNEGGEKAELLLLCS
ncbi:MAG: hypothetical protein A2Y97_02770, partial [Nitrospirae bacterium RBG_13_39_12]